MSPVEIFSGKFFRAASCYLGYLRYFALAAGSIMRLNFADKCRCNGYFPSEYILRFLL